MTVDPFEFLTEEAFRRTQETLASFDHHPSPAMLAGLKSIIQTLTLMLKGGAGPACYVSSLDPGCGKSTAIICWLKVYTEDPDRYGRKGILLGFDRYEEIARFIRDSSLRPELYAVSVADSSGAEAVRLNASGRTKEHAGEALILFTTKAQIIQRSLGRLFNAVPCFYFQGLPRAVRIWDEAYLAGHPLALDRLGILSILRTVRKGDPALARLLEDIAIEVKTCSSKDVFQMPDLGYSLNDFLWQFKWSGNERETAQTLALMQGKLVTVREAGGERILVDSAEAIPEDFKPCLVTDASAQVRETYRFQAQRLRDIVELKPKAACKRYDALTVHHWDQPSGKDSYRKRGITPYALEVARVIASRTMEEFLVVIQKEHEGRYQSELFKHLFPGDRDRIHFITWGRHLATNDYAHIPNVIITSPLLYRLADYEALTRAAGNYTTADGPVSDEQRKATEVGESAHHLLQVIGRGVNRKSTCEGICHESRVWIIAAEKKTGIKRMLPRLFPGCSVVTWNPERHEALTGKRKAAFQYLLQERRKGRSVVSGAELTSFLKMTRFTFGRDIRNHYGFLKEITAEGFEVVRRGQGYWFQEVAP